MAVQALDSARCNGYASFVAPPRHPIRAVSQLTGIPVDTLRAWERRYAAVRPARDARGRLYSEEDVERLRHLRRAIASGHAIGRIAALPLEELKQLVQGPASAASPLGVDLSRLQDAVARFDGPALRRELSRLAAVLPVRALCRDVALPFLRAIGEAWEAGTLDIAREHLATAEVRSLLGALARLRDGRQGGGAIVFATPAGELHEVGALAAAVVAADVGLEALFLGASLPAGEIVQAVRRVDAPAVVLGWTGAKPPAGPDPCAAIVDVVDALGRDAEVWVGGRGAREAARASGGRALPLDGFDGYERALARLRRA